MNLLVLAVNIIFVFACVILASRFFGKEGLTAWIAIASILANIMTAKTAEVFGVSFTIGTVLFASTFLATDILTERYGKKEALKAVAVGACSTIVFIVCSQIALWFIPTVFDYAHEHMVVLFSLSLRISISSVVMYVLANLADVYIYDAIRQKTKGKYMWLRNNVATILCNCLENFFFMTFAFIGIYDFPTIIEMALATSLIEALVGICDTPFLYMAVGKPKIE